MVRNFSYFLPCLLSFRPVVSRFILFQFLSLLGPSSALAFLFFQRYHILNEPFPNFDTRSSWYNIMLLLGHNQKGFTENTTPISYDQQRKGIAELFHQFNVISNKATHTMRFVAAQWAKALGCDGDEIRIHGRWKGMSVPLRCNTSHRVLIL